MVISMMLIFIAAVYAKVTYEARNEYKKAGESLQAEDIPTAITHFNRAIHWYAPGSSAVKKSIEHLWQLGTLAEQSEDYALALRAYRELRSSLYSARSFYTPHTDWIEKCDNRIADLIATGKASDALTEGRASSKTSREEVLAILKTKTEPDYFWSIGCELGFLGWIGCTVGFICFVFVGQRGFHARRAVVWGALIVLFYAVWIVGMLRA